MSDKQIVKCRTCGNPAIKVPGIYEDVFQTTFCRECYTFVYSSGDDEYARVKNGGVVSVKLPGGWESHGT